jgi:hypothetical protein
MDNTTRSRTFPDNDEANATPPPPEEAAPVYYEGCPGCAMERKVENSTGIPYKEFVFVGVTSLASGTYMRTPPPSTSALSMTEALLDRVYTSLDRLCLVCLMPGWGL